MADKTFIIIFSAINVLMWISVADWMRRTNRNYMEFINACMKDIRHASDVVTEDEKDIAKAMQKSDRMIAKGEEYYHKTFQQINQMTEMNVTAMSEFISQISDIILSGENKEKTGDETKNRK